MVRLKAPTEEEKHSLLVDSFEGLRAALQNFMLASWMFLYLTITRSSGL